MQEPQDRLVYNNVLTWTVPPPQSVLQRVAWSTPDLACWAAYEAVEDVHASGSGSRRTGGRIGCGAKARPPLTLLVIHEPAL